MAKGLWVVLNVDNVEKSVEFYKRLGLKAGTASMGPMTWGYVNTTSPDAGLVLWNKNATPPDPQPADTRAWLSGELGKGVVLTLGVPNAQKTWEKAQAAGAAVDQPLEGQPWGGQSFTLVDPDGYVVSFQDKFPGGGAPSRKPAGRKARKVAPKARRAVTKKKGRRTR
ncbi:MAG TPA: VOC family protein [Candidatus Thermoplasmatota archaeon]|nr:VOC family protein [Candidatus Thermoplasmatota archaeon]